MGGGGSKVEEHKAKISAMSAMQAKMKQLEQDLIDKDVALQKERKLHVAMKDSVRGELKKPDPVPKKASQKKKKKKKKKLLPNGCVDKERMKELAKMSSWSLEPDMLEEDETESEPEPESELDSVIFRRNIFARIKIEIYQIIKPMNGKRIKDKIKF